LTVELGLDKERARWWTIGQTLAWSTDASRYPQHLELVRWLLEDAQ
jgi:streptomycin 6-kinase